MSHYHDFLSSGVQYTFILRYIPFSIRGPGSSVHIATDYELDSSVHIATDYELDSPGSNPGGDEIFRPSRPSLGPRSLL